MQWKYTAIRLREGSLILSNGRGNEPLLLPWPWAQPTLVELGWNRRHQCYELRAVYGAEQARRGKALYSQNCSNCHMDNLQGNCPGENIRASTAYVCAPRGSSPPLVGDAFLQRWYSAGDLYSRIRWSMPADNVGGLSADDNLAILAYVLQSNGLPAGRELRDDVTAMKAMVLQEKTKNPVRNDGPITV